MKHAAFQGVLAMSWSDPVLCQSSMLKLSLKLKRLKGPLRDFNK